MILSRWLQIKLYSVVTGEYHFCEQKNYELEESLRCRARKILGFSKAVLFLERVISEGFSTEVLVTDFIIEAFILPYLYLNHLDNLFCFLVAASIASCSSLDILGIVINLNSFNQQFLYRVGSYKSH